MPAHQKERETLEQGSDPCVGKKDVPCQIRTGDLRIAYSRSSHNLYETDVITDYTNETCLF
jgi:hypothetical protein